MVEAGRVPEYAIQNLYIAPGVLWPLHYSTNPNVDPIHGFVSKNYTRLKSFPYFEVWKRKKTYAKPTPPNGTRIRPTCSLPPTPS